jgi:UDP-N-acetylmuramoyl-L-alanyl-D-glutamate--2,6-diaminopimelate ligase
VKLSTLAREVPHARRGPALDPEIRAVTHDSRAAEEGTLFAAFPGLVSDGRAFLPDAIRRGASAALGLAPAPTPLAVPYLEVENPRRAAGLLAARLADAPAERLLMVGVTGTSGKTTTTLLLDALLAKRHPHRGLFGTLVYRAAGGPKEASRTTPEATELQPMLAELLESGGTAAVMECSSHAIALERLAGCRFDVAVFTNLSRDHLDFHRDMEDYFETKARLFTMLKPEGTAIVNSGDAWGAQLLARLEPSRRVSFALGEPETADVTGRAELHPSKTRLVVTRAATGETLAIDSALLGRPNAENLLAAAAVGLVLGLPPLEIGAALSSVDAVPGRLEAIPNERGLTVIVDYAHKPGALEGVLLTARALAERTGGRVISIFGCGGDRDRGKRAEMGRISARLADVTIVTSDNPRTEDPAAIVEEIHAGVVAEGREATATVLVDRREAVREALRRARPGDVVLLAGKGHETYQEIAGVKHPFDDREVVKELLVQMGVPR